VQVWADKDERRCEVCGKLHQKTFSIYEPMPVPAHPRCRCCIVPVVDDVKQEPEKQKTELPKIVNKFGQEAKVDDFLIKKYDKWQAPIELLSKLADEYDNRIVKVERTQIFGGGSFNATTGVLGLGTNKPYATLHEFAHSISSSQLMKLGVEDTKDFWKEIKSIRRRYKKELDAGKIDYISLYEVGNNDDEFMAEAFTHAKLIEMGLELPKERYGKDTTYSKEVLAAVNEYFKKKKK
jgi:hypothetical protein